MTPSLIIKSSGAHPDQPHYSKETMTQQQLLQGARNVLTAARTDVGRTGLKTAAMAVGRSKDAVSKASTMRLAMWVSKGTSAI